MKKIPLIILVVLLAGCAAPQVTIPSTNTPILPTATPVPTEIPLPSPTPTPEPYLLDEGILLDWDESLEEYIIVAEEIDALTTTAEGEIVALDGGGYPRFVFDGDFWEELKVDPNYGYIATEQWGEESLPLVKEWWEGYKEKMPTNEDIKWMTYEDGGRVEMGEMPNLRYATTRTYGVILADMFDFPDSIDSSGDEQMLLTLLPTNADKTEEAGDIVPVRLTTTTEYTPTVSLRIIGNNQAIRDNRIWNSVDAAYNIPHKELLRFLHAGLSGDKPLLYGCQLAVSIVGTNLDSEWLNYESDPKSVTALHGVEGDGEWEVDYVTKGLPRMPQGAGLFAIPESCMTEIMWEVFRTLPNNPIGG